MSTLLDRYIEIPTDRTPARIAGTEVSIAAIVLRHLKWHMPLGVLRLRYDLPLSALHAALAYYYDHTSQIDPEIAMLENQPEESWEEFQRKFQTSMTTAGYDTQEKLIDLVRQVKQEIVTEQDFNQPA